MNDYIQKFASYSDIDLVKIIDTPEKHESEAVQAAIEILNSRELSPEEYKTIKETLESREIVSPLQEPNSFIDKGINFITICCVLLFLFYIYTGFNYIRYLFGANSGDREWLITPALYIIDFLYFPIAVFLFYRRKKNGWILITYSCIHAIISNLVYFKIKLSYLNEGAEHGFNLSSLSLSNPMLDIIRILLFSSWLWFLSKKGVQEIYGITNKILLLTVVISLAITLIIYQLIPLLHICLNFVTLSNDKNRKHRRILQKQV